MESLSMALSSSSLPKLSFSKPVSLLPALMPFPSKLLSTSHQTHLSSTNKIPLQHHTLTSKPPRNHPLLLKNPSLLKELSKIHLPLAISQIFFAAFPCFASETQLASDRVNLEAILVAIDDFFNRYPFFVAGCTFIWLVVMPLTEEYFKKYKYISAIDAFRKLRDDPNAQLLDIRDKKSLAYLRSPNLKILGKGAVQVHYTKQDEAGFLKNVLESLGDTAETVVCVLDSFDGNSLKVAELLFKNGVKEAYAIKGGVRGEKGWMAIQETLLPPSVHMYPRKKAEASQNLGTGGRNEQDDDKTDAITSANDYVGEGQRLR